MSDNSRWPEAWDRLVDRVNQDPNIQAFEEIDSFNGGRGAISSLKNLKTKEKFTCFTSHDSKHDGRMYFVYDDDYTIPTGRSVKGKRRRTQTLATVDELIDLFNKSYNSTDVNSGSDVSSFKLKDLAQEQYNNYGAYNRKRNAAADEYRPNSGAPEPAPAEWDEIMDKANNDPKYKVYSDTVLKTIRNLETNAVYKIRWRGDAQEWQGKDMELQKIVPVEDIIAKAKADVFGNGSNVDVNLGENLRRFGVKNLNEAEYKVAGRPVTLNKNGTEDQTKWTVTFTATGKTAQYSDVISLIKPRPKLQDPRWQDSDGDGKWYEKGDDVKEITEGHNDHGMLNMISTAEDIVQNLRKNMATNSVLQREEKHGYLRAYDELLDVLSEIGYHIEMQSDQQ